jgi:hypothetical protein
LGVANTTPQIMKGREIYIYYTKTCEFAVIRCSICVA